MKHKLASIDPQAIALNQLRNRLSIFDNYNVMVTVKCFTYVNTAVIALNESNCRNFLFNDKQTLSL